MTRTAVETSRSAFRATVNTDCSVGQLLRALSDEPGLFALESSCDTGGYGRFSIVGVEPIDDLRHHPQTTSRPHDDSFAALETVVAELPHIDADRLPFAGGWVGYIPYECGLTAAGIAKPDTAAMRFALYDSAAIFDHQTGKWTICAIELPSSHLPIGDRIRSWNERFERAAAIETYPAESTDGPKYAGVVSNMTRDEYFQKVARAIEYIRAGDIYQVNVTQRFTATTDTDPLSLYLRLQQVNPADYAAFFLESDRAILCASPELFVQLSPDGSLVTRPIKGTRPRIGDDGLMREELRNSPKDRAELAMIVDLLRNDLGRVSQFGSIKVLQEAEVETHPTVHHLVGTIVGKAKPELSRVDILRAMFPGGSITGCPKIRAMQIIDELESTPREAYCGAIGYIGADGSMTMNIAIRTMIHRGDEVHVYTGGAITADSNPLDEYEETLSKAAGMFCALGLDGSDIPTSV